MPHRWHVIAFPSALIVYPSVLAIRVFLQVLLRGLYPAGFFEKAQCHIALPTQKPSHRARCVIMVNRESLARRWRFPTDRADIALLRYHLIVFVDCQSIGSL